MNLKTAHRSRDGRLRLQLSPTSWQPGGTQQAFSLIEVMIAMAIFFMAVFAILDLTTHNIATARRLQASHVDASSIAAALSLTNFVEEGELPPAIVAQFEEQYPGYRCFGDIYEVSTNGLFQVDLVVTRAKGGRGSESTMSLLLFRPGGGRRR